MLTHPSAHCVLRQPTCHNAATTTYYRTYARAGRIPMPVLLTRVYTRIQQRHDPEARIEHR